MSDASLSFDHNRLKLPAVLDFAAADGLLETLQRRIAEGSAPTLDASDVETLTLPCAQIVFVAIRGDGRIRIADPSQAFVEAFNDLALDWSFAAASDGPVPTEAVAAVAEDAMAESAVSEEAESPVACADEPATVVADDATASCMPDQSDVNGDLPEQAHEDVMPKRILTIDDSKTMRDMLMLTLADAGFEVLQAVDGQNGLDVLGDDKVDVVITDINMPVMDGYEVIRQLRQNPVHKKTPILVLTTESDADKRNLAREAGATGWMVKPFDPSKLIATIRRVSP